MSRRVIFWLAAICGLALVRPAWAHDLPADIVVQLFVKPAGRTLQVIARVPLSAMQDVDYPTTAAGALDLGRADAALRDAATLWLMPGLPVYENGRVLRGGRLVAVRAALPSDRSFSSFDEARAHVAGSPLPPDIRLDWNQGMLDALIEYDIASDRSAFSIEPALARLAVHVTTAVRFLPPGGAVRAFEWRGDPGLVRLDPRWDQAALRFVRLGVEHILSGADHLLFLVALVIPVRRLRALLPVVTAFAAAHSITLIASALGLAPDPLWFPPLVEVLIAASIVYLALENILAPHVAHRWRLAFLFGLVHGFGFSFALRGSMQFAGAHLLLSLFSFNLGVELGQILALAVVIPPLRYLAARAISTRTLVVVLSAIVGHTAWHWLIERAAALGRFTWAWPAVDAAAAAKIADWLLVGVVTAAGLWWIRTGSRTASTALRE